MKWGFSMASKEISVDEDLPIFYEAVKRSSAREIIDENYNMQENFGFEINDPDTIEELAKASFPIREMQGTPWYQLLSNPIYSFKFYYVGAFITEREKIIEDKWEAD